MKSLQVGSHCFCWLRLLVTFFLVYFTTFDCKRHVPWDFICGNPLRIGIWLHSSRKGLYLFLPVFKGLFQPQTTYTSTCRGVLSAQEKAGNFHPCPFCVFSYALTVSRFHTRLPTSLLTSWGPQAESPGPHIPQSNQNSSSTSPVLSRNHHRKDRWEPYSVLAFTTPSASRDSLISCHFSDAFSWFGRRGYLSILSHALYSSL